MQNSIKYLNEKFIQIKDMGWIKNQREGNSGIGYTFEKLIGKEEDNFFLPDFNGIEIKTKHNFSKGYLTLFNLTPDGDYLFPLNYLRENYGYPDKIMKSEKIFQFSINNSSSCILKNFLFYIYVDYIKEKVVLKIKNLKNDIIDSSISWSFKSIEDRIYNKINFLAIVMANSKHIDKIEYLHYYDIKFYKLRGLNTFLSLLEDGRIRITFKVGIFRNGKRIGQIHDHGTGFDINLKDISLLFETIPRTRA